MSKEPEVITEFNLTSALVDLARSKDVDIVKLEKLIELHERTEDRQREAAYSEAMASFKGECPAIPKTGKVDFKAGTGRQVKYDYAPLDEISRAIDKPMARNGLSYDFNSLPSLHSEGKSTLFITINHKSGWKKVFEWEYDPIHQDAGMNDSQKRKSALSYAKRTGLEMALGLATTGDDDDSISAYERIDENQESSLDPQDVRIEFGGFAGRRFWEVPVGKLEDYYAGLEERIKNKSAEPRVLKFMEDCQSFLEWIEAGGVPKTKEEHRKQLPNINTSKDKPSCCNQSMMTSKYDESKWYCVKCKTLREK